MDRADARWWRLSTGRGAGLALIVLGVMFALSLTRVLSAFEADALTIAVLMGLLLWTQLARQRDTRRLAEKLDLLATRLRYGPLTDEDLDTIRVLKSARQAHYGAAEASAPRNGWVSRLWRLRRRPAGPDSTPPVT